MNTSPVASLSPSGAPAEPDDAAMSAYLDAELDADEAAAFEARLAESPEAQAELADLEKVLSLVSRLPSVDAPEDFYDELSRRIRRKAMLKPDNPWLTLIALPFQVLSILVILAVAALYMMAELDRYPGPLEREHPPASSPDR